MQFTWKKRETLYIYVGDRRRERLSMQIYEIEEERGCLYVRDGR